MMPVMRLFAALVVLLQTVDCSRSSDEIRNAPPTAASERPSESIGVATLKDDGTIVLRLRARSPSGALGEALLTYSPDHPRYRDILSHIGPIQKGQSVNVKPWPD
jgi:hypothetical protein